MLVVGVSRGGWLVVVEEKFFPANRSFLLQPPPHAQDQTDEMLHQRLQEALEKRERRAARRRLTLLPSTAVDFSSNDFLSLSTSPALRRRFLALLQDAPAEQPFASGGSRLLDGNSQSAEELERYIARVHEAPCALLFNSGFDANVGVLECLPQPGDVVLYDEHVHASVHEGMRLSRAGVRRAFRHSSPESLGQVLGEVLRADPGIGRGERSVFVAVESVYSMDGDIAPLRELVDVVDRLVPGNGYFIVDEAHATGVLGVKGTGVVQDLGLQERMLIRVHTFGKALASHGAVVLCSPQVRDYLINYARSLIYTTALGYPFLASIRAAYEMMAEGDTEVLRQTLQQRIQLLRERLAQLQQPAGIFRLGHSPASPVLSLLTPYPRQMAEACQRAGFIVRAIMAPTVAPGQERVRVCVHAGNTVDEVEGLVAVIRGLDSSLARL